MGRGFQYERDKTVEGRWMDLALCVDGMWLRKTFWCDVRQIQRVSFQRGGLRSHMATEIMNSTLALKRWRIPP